MIYRSKKHLKPKHIRRAKDIIARPGYLRSRHYQMVEISAAYEADACASTDYETITQCVRLAQMYDARRRYYARRITRSASI